jgi:hypothetical protein
LALDLVGPTTECTVRVFVTLAGLLKFSRGVNSCPERHQNWELERSCECMAVTETCGVCEYKGADHLILLAVGAASSFCRDDRRPTFEAQIFGSSSQVMASRDSVAERLKLRVIWLGYARMPICIFEVPYDVCVCFLSFLGSLGHILCLTPANLQWCRQPQQRVSPSSKISHYHS